MILVKLCYLEQSVLHLSNGNIMHALIIGATGATGSALLTQLLSDEKFSQVSIFVRKPVAVKHEKLIVHVIDFDKINDYRDSIHGDVLFCCLGTTAQVAGSPDAQWKIEYDYPYQFAQCAKANGVPQFVLVSARFANPNSKMFYTRLKGQIEDAIINLNFPSLSIVRPPSLIRPNTDRFSETIAIKVFNGLDRLGLMRAMRPIHVDVLAKVMISLAKQSPKGVNILESLDIWDWSDKS